MSEFGGIAITYGISFGLLTVGIADMFVKQKN